MTNNQLISQWLLIEVIHHRLVMSGKLLRKDQDNKFIVTLNMTMECIKFSRLLLIYERQKLANIHHTTISINLLVISLNLACEQQTYFRSSFLSPSSVGERRTENVSALRRRGFKRSGLRTGVENNIFFSLK